MVGEEYPDPSEEATGSGVKGTCHPLANTCSIQVQADRLQGTRVKLGTYLGHMAASSSARVLAEQT